MDRLAGKKYTARDKTVAKMTREGLTEENLRDGSVKPVTRKSRGHPQAREEVRDSRGNSGQMGEPALAGKSKTQLRMYRYTSFRYEKTGREEKNPGVRQEKVPDEEKRIGDQDTARNQTKKKYREKFREQEKIPDTDGLEKQEGSIKKKQKKIRLTEEQKKAGRLSFDDEGNQMIRSPGMGIVKKSAGAAVSAVAGQVSQPDQENQDNNAGADSLQAGEKAAAKTAAALVYVRKKYRQNSLYAVSKRGRSDTITGSRLQFGRAPTQDVPKGSPEKRQSLLNRFFQKKRYKEAYRTAAASAGKTGGAAVAGGVENMTVKAKIALKEILRRNRTVFAGVGIFGLIFLLIAASFGSCSAAVQGSGSVIGITTYPSSDEDIYAAENAYLELENALNEQINNMETAHPGYDEYNYNVSEISHNPYHLISYLTAKYGDWTYADVSDEIETLFSAQYSLTTEEKTETVTETRTVRVGESLGQVVTSGYCSCSICCGQWAGGPTASGVYPTANHTLAVDAYNPIVPIGTRVVMNGVEYTVEDTGAFAGYGVDFDVYYDDHAAASAHGHQTWECYLADANGTNEITVTDTQTKKILYITLQNKGFDAVARQNLNEEQQILYDALNTTLGNRDYLWDTGTISGGSGGMDYEIPPEALEDEAFARMIREAEKYLGVPYVWGGYSPSGFDCSGFVSYVINHCGNGWNYGRLTADGLRAQCANIPPSEAKPGDLIFFQGTYATPGASHVGIYVGNGMMIHCGDPVQYANINSSYWQQHFLSFGRLP